MTKKKHKINILVHTIFFLMTQLKMLSAPFMAKVFDSKNIVSTHIGILRFSFKELVKRLTA